MGEYVRPWRRKVGVLTLVMACVFMAGWVRSQRMTDFVTICTNHRTMYSLSSSTIGISLNRLLEPPPLNGPPIWCGSYSHLSSVILDSVEGQNNQPDWFIHYWAIVVHLTLISAYLLLSKPRKSDQKKITEPIPEKVA